MKNLYIVGAGDFGRELAGWLISPGGLPEGCRLMGFLDDTVQGEPVAGISVVNTIQAFRPSENDELLMGVAVPATKKALYQSLQPKGTRFASYLHPRSIISSTAALGEGCVLCPGALVSHAATVGRCVTLNAYATIGHDVRIGDFSTASSHVDVTGRVVVGEESFFGSHASVLPGVLIGARATVGAGAVVLKQVAAGNTVFGVPARCIAHDGS